MNAQRYKVGYYTDEWGMSSNTPCLIKDEQGYAVKFEDYEAVKKQRDELAKALESFADWYDERCGDNECRPLENARAALASVKGGATSATCLHTKDQTIQTGDGTPVSYCPDCGRNEVQP